MRTRPKNLGTQFETRIVRRAQDHGLVAERLPEGGAYDRGDIRILTDTEWVGECKFSQQLNIHETLENAILKSGTPHTVVFWRRMKRLPGQSRRVQVGVPIVAMTIEAFFELLKEDT